MQSWKKKCKCLKIFKSNFHIRHFFLHPVVVRLLHSLAVQCCVNSGISLYIRPYEAKEMQFRYAQLEFMIHSNRIGQ